MNVHLLTDFLGLCARAKVPAIPATMGPHVPLDELQRAIEGLGKTPTLDEARAWLEENAKPPAMMWRWDCCAPPDLKEAAAEGVTEAPTIGMDLDDERFQAILGQLEASDEEDVCVVARPWIKAKREGDLPVELRAFVSPKGIAVSNYHAGRPLPDRYLEEARMARAMCEKLLAVGAPKSFTADFLLSERGELLFLEGGPPWTRRGLVDGCCFEGEPVPGAVALKHRPPRYRRGAERAEAGEGGERPERPERPEAGEGAEPRDEGEPSPLPPRGGKAPFPRLAPVPRVMMAPRPNALQRPSRPPEPPRSPEPPKAAEKPAEKPAEPAREPSGEVSTGPLVGIFWLHAKRLVVFTEEASSIEPIEGARDSRFDHDEQWDEVLDLYPELEGHEYFELPRGRVVERVDEGLFDLFLPSQLQNHAGLRSAVTRAFRLPADKVRVRKDDHYEIRRLPDSERCPVSCALPRSRPR